MTWLRLWAPAARRVELALGGERLAMTRAPDGEWTLRVPALQPGCDYAFVLDGGPPLPDPRSSWQPHGVHGASRRVDAAAFPWSDAGWQAPPLASGLVYELHVGTFTPEGTFDAAIPCLDHLVDLGVTHVELMPVAEFPGRRGWGYDGVDLYAPHHAYGGPDALRRLVDACHGCGLAVILDVVYNHLGPDGNHLGRFGPYFTNRHTTPWGSAINLDGRGSDQVRRFLCDNALGWLRDYHFDGLRLDAVHAIIDASAVHFLEQLAEEVAALEAGIGRHLVLIAESDLNDPRIIRPREVGGYGIDAQWNEDFHHALHAVLTGERQGYYADFGRLEDLAKALRDAFVYDGRHSAYRGRRHGRPATGCPGQAFLGFLQNHDQVGNRARGERIGHLVSPGRLRVGAAVLLTAPFVPMLFQGEEWAASTPFQYFTDHQDPALGRAVTEGRWREFAAFGWEPQTIPDPQSPATYEASKLRWEEREDEPHRSLLDWYRSLIRLRREEPALRDGRLERVRVAWDDAAGWIRIERPPFVVACNLAGSRQRIPLPEGARFRTRLASEGAAAPEAGGIALAPESVAILEERPSS